MRGHHEHSERKSRPSVALLALIALALLPHACRGGEEGIVAMKGMAFADRPLTGATIEVFDTEGKALAVTQQTSDGDPSGAFRVDVEELPSDFRVVASGGTVGGRLFAGRLVADVEQFDAHGGAVYLSPMTTLVSAHVDNHPQMTLAEATASVKRLLDMPEVARLCVFWVAYIGVGRFMEEALGKDGLAAYEKALALEAGSGATYAIPPVAESSVPGWDGSGSGLWQPGCIPDTGD